MRYYSEEEVKEFMPIYYWQKLSARGHPINICFCHECEFFHKFYPQNNPEFQEGYCFIRSDCGPEEEVPFFVYTTSNSFCDKTAMEALKWKL